MPKIIIKWPTRKFKIVVLGVTCLLLLSSTEKEEYTSLVVGLPLKSFDKPLPLKSFDKPLPLKSFDVIQNREQELTQESHKAFKDFVMCQQNEGSFPCMDLIDRMTQFDSRSFWDKQTRHIETRQLKVDYVNDKFGLSFDRIYPNFKLEKYFIEAKDNDHIDNRFFNESTKIDFSVTLPGIIRAWSYFAYDYKIEDWWIAHGNLLAWSWNGLVFPWGNIDKLIYR